jgi:hypothetical protein
MRKFHKVKYNVGDKVYWNDPDNDECSGWYRVVKVTDADILFVNNPKLGVEFPVFHDEIRNPTTPKQWSKS